MNIKETIKEAHENAVKHGFWGDWLLVTLLDGELVKYARGAVISKNLMLIVGELAEAQEALRYADMDNFKEELADVAIRLFDLCGGLDIDLEAEIQKKMEKNKNRPYKHNKEF